LAHPVDRENQELLLVLLDRIAAIAGDSGLLLQT